jgi:translocation and assembly module TamB
MSDANDMAPVSTPRRPRRWARWLAGSLVLLVALLTGGYLFLGSQAALDYALQRVMTAADGRLTIEGGEGSLLSTVRMARIAWRGDDIDVEANDVALTWSPTDLLSRRFNVQGLGAKRIALELRPSRATATGLPANLALPLEVAVHNVGVERLEWKTGDGNGAVTGITFGYRGGAREHAIDNLRFVTVYGTLTGDVVLGALPPFALRGALGFEGDAAMRDARAALTVGGALERIDVGAKGTLREAAVTIGAVVTPFADTPVVSADIDAANVNVAQFDPAWPTTSLTVKLAARPSAGGFAGTVDARNAQPGTLDAGRIPVAALRARYAWDGKAVQLADIAAELNGGGTASGSGSVPLDGRPTQWDLSIGNVNLASIQSSLIATRLSGTLAAEVAEKRQVVRADLRQADMALSFAATVEGARIAVERFRAQAGTGELTGSGNVALDGTRAFKVAARATRFDPARFADVPAGQLDGTVTATGTLAPSFDVTAAVVLAPGSLYADVPLHGTARARVTRTSAKDVAVNLQVGTAKIVLAGAFGTPADRLDYNLDVPRIELWRAPLARYAKFALPEPVAGSLRARGTISGDPRSPGFTIDAQGAQLQWGPGLHAEAMTVTGSLAPGITERGPVGLDARPIALTITASSVRTPPADLKSLRFAAEGTLAQHAAKVSAVGDGMDVAMAVTGGVREVKRADGTPEPAWFGRLESFTNRGTHPVRLEAPAVLEVARDRLHVGSARIAVADGRAELVTLTVDDGRLSTSGSFTGIPANTLARLAGTEMPLASTLKLGGKWSLAATPRLNGTLEVRREEGDLFATDSLTPGPAGLALGIIDLALAATWRDDALEATARFRSTRAGTADATASVAAGSVPGRMSTTAPMTGKVTADLASLRPLQPWLGTLAVLDGRARIDVDARGTLADPNLAGTMTGDALRFDLPQFGVHLRDGRLRARLADRALVLDEFSFAGGDGRFTAKGTLARAANAADRANASASVTWEATDFTVVNRPDLRLVADGKGTLALTGGKLVLAGGINIDEGRVVYERATDGRLSDDVVIVGQPRPTAADATRTLPLRLDLQVALGRDFRFSGEGLETRLAGSVHVTTTPAGTVAAKGTIRAVSGTYYVFGQRLDIDRGRLIFDGPADNPALDVVALRRNVSVEAGVEVTGTVRVPRVRLVSNPPVPDGEKLSWLITGQGLDRASRADLAALSAASASLLGQNQRPITTQIANTFGLDDITVRDGGATTSSGTGGQVVAFGKRISDRLTLIYEQGLSVATNALRIEYALSRTLTLRAEAGTISSAGIFYRRSFD